MRVKWKGGTIETVAKWAVIEGVTEGRLDGGRKKLRWGEGEGSSDGERGRGAQMGRGGGELRWGEGEGSSDGERGAQMGGGGGELRWGEGEGNLDGGRIA